jgi:hypothetical protein
LLSSIIWKRYVQPPRNKKLRCSRPRTSSMPAIWLTLYACIKMYIWISKYMLTIQITAPMCILSEQISPKSLLIARRGTRLPLVSMTMH